MAQQNPDGSVITPKHPDTRRTEMLAEQAALQAAEVVALDATLSTDVEAGLLKTSLVPIRVVNATADMVLLGSTAGVHDIEQPGVVANAKSLDIVFPVSRGCAVGKWIDIDFTAFSDLSTAVSIYFSAWTMVAGVAIHNLSAPAAWHPPWFFFNGQRSKSVGKLAYQLQAGDFEADGTVRIRMRCVATNTVIRTINCINGHVLILEGRGPFVLGPP